MNKIRRITESAKWLEKILYILGRAAADFAVARFLLQSVDRKNGGLTLELIQAHCKKTAKQQRGRNSPESLTLCSASQIHVTNGSRSHIETDALSEFSANSCIRSARETSRDPEGSHTARGSPPRDYFGGFRREYVAGSDMKPQA